MKFLGLSVGVGRPFRHGRRWEPRGVQARDFAGGITQNIEMDI